MNETAGTVTLIIRTDVIGGPQSGAVQFYTENGEATGKFPLPFVVSYSRFSRQHTTLYSDHTLLLYKPNSVYMVNGIYIFGIGSQNYFLNEACTLCQPFLSRH